MTAHPWHPVFVHFPLACWVLATAIDLAGQLFLIPQIPGTEWASLSHLLLWGGVALGAPAMIAGLMDYARLPCEVQESAELSWHIVTMATAWVLFLAAAVWRVRAAPFASAPSWGMTLLELVGTAGLVVGGRFAAVVVFERMPASRNSVTVRETGEKS